MVSLKQFIKVDGDSSFSQNFILHGLPEENVKLSLVISVSEDKEEAIKNAKECMNDEKISRDLDLAKAKVQAEAMYMGIKGEEISVYQKMLRYLISLKNIFKLNKIKFIKNKGWAIIKIIILSLATGGGHMKTAYAIKDYLKSKGEKANVIDTLKYLNPLLDKVITNGYKYIVTKLPFIYKFMYTIYKYNFLVFIF